MEYVLASRCRRRRPGVGVPSMNWAAACRTALSFTHGFATRKT